MPEFKSLVFDVDNTLLWTTDRIKRVSGKPFETIRFRSYDDYEDLNMHVVLRPGAKEILKTLSTRYRIGLWSVGKPQYLKEVVKVLGVSEEAMSSETTYDYIPVSFIYNWSHCYRDNGRMYKPLIHCPFSTDAQSRQCCIIEDSPEACSEGDPSIIVSPFKGDLGDNELFHLLARLMV